MFNASEANPRIYRSLPANFEPAKGRKLKNPKSKENPLLLLPTLPPNSHPPGVSIQASILPHTVTGVACLPAYGIQFCLWVSVTIVHRIRPYSSTKDSNLFYPSENCSDMVQFVLTSIGSERSCCRNTLGRFISIIKIMKKRRVERGAIAFHVRLIWQTYLMFVT